ncbi:unnamed protein product [Schistosoma margrebowiei]|uniref:Uncharacterized protein n=1 Tax=Schistosoma margrebowiei TaxID=48269 RepID=A0A183M0H9_9TREM|nr:unnamed protein product [Schistosoma margrebowiei]
MRKILRGTLEYTCLLDPQNIEAAPPDLPVDVTPPTIEEIRLAIRQINGSSLNNPLNGTRHHTPISLTMRRCLTLWTGEYYGNFFDAMEVLLKLSTLSKTHTTDHTAKSCMKDS